MASCIMLAVVPLNCINTQWLGVYLRYTPVQPFEVIKALVGLKSYYSYAYLIPFTWQLVADYYMHLLTAGRYELVDSLLLLLQRPRVTLLSFSFASLSPNCVMKL